MPRRTVQQIEQHKAQYQLQLLFNCVRATPLIVDEDCRRLLLAQVLDIADTVGVSFTKASVDSHHMERAIGPRGRQWAPRHGGAR